MAEPVSPALSPPPGNPRFPLLDAARGVAAGMIVAYHVAGAAGVVTGGSVAAPYFARLNVGVTIFFVISAFLLYRPFVAARLEGRPPVRLRDYARRRGLRILPGYWVALTVLAVWPGLVGIWDAGWWKYYVFAQNYSPATILGGISAAWSLAVEMSFYVALPLLAAGLAWLAARRGSAGTIRRELIALGAIAAASLGFQAFWAGSPLSYELSTLPALMDWFAAGMALAVLSVAWHGRPPTAPGLRLVMDRPWVPWLAAALLYWVVSTRLGLPANPFQTRSPGADLAAHVLYVACAVLLLLPAMFGSPSRGWLRHLLASRPLAWFGLVSYGVFLYHGPLLAELERRGASGWIPGSGFVSLGVTTLAATTAAAAASYYLVERPALKLKDRRRPLVATGAAGGEPAHDGTGAGTSETDGSAVGART